MLVILPLMIIWVVTKKFRDPEGFDEEKYGFFLEEANTSCMMQAFASLFYIFRRVIFTSILYF